MTEGLIAAIIITAFMAIIIIELAVIRRHGLQRKFRGNARDDEYIAKRISKPKNYEPRDSAFSIVVQGDLDFINIRLLPTSKEQARTLIELLEKQGGDVIFERDGVV